MFTTEARSVSTASPEAGAFANAATAGAVPLFQRVETYFILLALFIFATGASFLTPAMLNSADNSAVLTGTSDDGSPLHMLQLVLAFVIITPLTLTYWRSVLDTGLRAKFVTAAAFLAMFSALWSQHPGISFRTGLYLCLDTFFVYYLLRRFSADELMRLFIGLGVLTGVLSIVMAVILPGYAVTKASGLPALQGCFASKNGLGEMSALFLTPALFLNSMRRAKRVAYIALMLVVIFASFSVQAWSVALLSFCFVGVRNLRHRLRDRDFKWLAFVTLLPLVIGTIILALYWVHILESLGKDPTISGRTTIWGAVLPSIAKRPLLGWGYGAFWVGTTGEAGSVLAIIHFPIAQSQNGPLEVLLNTGSVGLLLVLGIFVQAFRDMRRSFFYGSDKATEWYLLLVLITIIYMGGEADLMLANSTAWMLFIMACTGLALKANSLHALPEGSWPLTPAEA